MENQRVAEIGDGWIYWSFHEDMLADIDDLNQRLVALGREPDSVEITIFDVYETCGGFKNTLIWAYARAVPRCPTEDKDSICVGLINMRKLTKDGQ